MMGDRTLAAGAEDGLAVNRQLYTKEREKWRGGGKGRDGEG